MGTCDLIMIFFFLTVFEGKWIFINININITDKRCADGKYNESLLSNGFNEVVTTFMCLSTFTLVNLKITYFCACHATVQQHMYANQFSFSWLVN